MKDLFGFKFYSNFSEGLIISFAFYTFIAILTISFLIGNFLPTFLALIIYIFLIHPIYILGLIIILNPFSDWLVVKLPSILTKVVVDILILAFILGTWRINFFRKKPWVKAPANKFILMLVILYIISSLIYWRGLEEFLFMNWIHFRFIYLAVAITQLKINDAEYTTLLKLIFLIFLIHIGLGLFQMASGEWGKSLFYQGGGKQVSLSYRLLQFKSYEFVDQFNEGGLSYIYSTFFTPTHYGGFLTLMLCLILGMRKVLQKTIINGNYTWPNFYSSIFLNQKRYIFILTLTIILIISTFSRTAYIAFFVLISFFILISGNSLLRLIIYKIALIALIFLGVNSEYVFNYLKFQANPEIGVFDPISRFLSVFAQYFGEETPRRIAYTIILPKVITETPFFGLGVNSVLNQENLFANLLALNNALFYVYGDAGIVRMFVEWGVIGVLVYTLLFISLFKHSRRSYLFSTHFMEKTISFTVMTSIILIIPIMFGTMLLLAKSYGLYLWMFIGFFQNLRNRNVQVHTFKYHYFRQYSDSRRPSNVRF